MIFFQNLCAHVQLFIRFIKKSCLSVCEETTTYSTAMCDMSLERKFHYLLYSMDSFNIEM